MYMKPEFCSKKHKKEAFIHCESRDEGFCYLSKSCSVITYFFVSPKIFFISPNDITFREKSIPTFSPISLNTSS